MGASEKDKRLSPEDVIAAFDRERDEAREHVRRHREWLRAARHHDQPASREHQPDHK